MKKYIISLSIALLLVGCGGNNDVKPQTQQQTVKNPYDDNVIIILDKPIKDIKIYIDDSLDLARNEEVKKLIKDELSKDLEVKLYKGSKKVEQDTRLYGWVIDNCSIMCDTKEIKKEDIQFTEDVIEVNNLKNPNEKISFYQNELWSKTYSPLRDKFAIRNIFNIEKDSIDNGKLIINFDFLNQYSIKKQLEKNLKEKGFIIVKNQKEADYTFIIKNVGFISKDTLYSVKIPTNFSNNINGTINTASLGASSAMLGGSSSGASAGVGVGLMAIGLLAGNANDNDITSVNAVSIYKKDNNIGQVVQITNAINHNTKNNYSYTNYTYATYSQAIDDINTQFVDELFKNKIIIKDNYI